MSLSDNYSPDSNVGNGVTTVFTGTWTPIAAAYMVVELVDTTDPDDRDLQILDSDYSLSFDDDGYIVTFLGTPPPSTVNVVRSRVIERTQDTPYETSRGFQGGNIEGSFDKLTGMIQELDDGIARSLTVPVGSTVTTSLGAPVANTFLGVNSLGTAFDYFAIVDLGSSIVSAFISTLLDDPDASTARTTLGAEGIITDLTAITTLQSTDQVAVADASDSNTSRKITLANFLSSLSIVTNVITQKFTATGTYTPTSGMKFCIAELFGGGGGGGGVNATANATAGGGGAGGYSRKRFTAANIGASQAVTIGAAGAAGANTGGTGGTGGTTSLGALLTAVGGTGGGGSTSATGSQAGGSGGAGEIEGAVTRGAPGNGTVTTNSSGARSGGGGSTLIGGAGKDVSTTSVGEDALANSGGGGSGAASGGSAHVGGAGGSGFVVITEYC